MLDMPSWDNKACIAPPSLLLSTTASHGVSTAGYGEQHACWALLRALMPPSPAPAPPIIGGRRTTEAASCSRSAAWRAASVALRPSSRANCASWRFSHSRIWSCVALAPAVRLPAPVREAAQ